MTAELVKGYARLLVEIKERVRAAQYTALRHHGADWPVSAGDGARLAGNAWLEMRG